MATLRYSGELRIRITYIDPKPGDQNVNGKYRCAITTPADGASETLYVTARALPDDAVDSSKAFDEVAHAALSFASAQGWPVEEHAASSVEGESFSCWHIGRSKADAFPKEKASVG